MIRWLLDQVPGQHVGLQTDNAQALYESLGFHPQPEFWSIVVGTWLDNAANRSTGLGVIAARRQPAGAGEHRFGKTGERRYPVAPFDQWILWHASQVTSFGNKNFESLIS